jgi:hypothetical protein
MITINYLERAWLNSRGGRNESDVLVDETGRRYVMMSAGVKDKEIPVYIPEDKEIVRLFKKKQ